MAASPSEPDLKSLFLDGEISYKFFVTHSSALLLCSTLL
jgi:hypothetical protein